MSSGQLSRVENLDARFYNLAVRDKREGKLLFDKRIENAHAQTTTKWSAIGIVVGSLFAVAAVALLTVHLMHNGGSLPPGLQWMAKSGPLIYMVTGAAFVLGTAIIVHFAIKVHRARQERKEMLAMIALDQKEYPLNVKALADCLGDNFKTDMTFSGIAKLDKNDYQTLPQNHYRIVPYKGTMGKLPSEMQKGGLRSTIVIKTIIGDLECTPWITEKQKDNVAAWLKIQGYEVSTLPLRN